MTPPPLPPSALFSTQQWVTLAQLTHYWANELTASGQHSGAFHQELIRALSEDIVNGHLDKSGPSRDGQCLGLRIITSGNRAGFIEGAKLLPLTPFAPSLLDKIVVMKEAALDFARRHQLPPPTWWTELPNSLQRGTPARDQQPARAAAEVGKKPRIKKLLGQHFPLGVPDAAYRPRKALRADLLKWDPSLEPLDDATLKSAIDEYNAALPST